MPITVSGKYSDGHDLFYYDKQNDVYKVWSYNGDLLCDIEFKNDIFWNGYAIQNPHSRYVFKGFFANGKRNGKGVEYDNKGAVIIDGDWKYGHLHNGEIRFVQTGSIGKHIKDVRPINFSEVKTETSKLTSKPTGELVEVADYIVQDGLLFEEKNVRKGTRIISW